MLIFLIIVFVIVPAFFLGRCYFEDHYRSVPDYTGKPIPTDQNIRTEKDYYKEKNEWLKRLTIDAYRRRQPEVNPASTAGVAFLEEVCRTVAYPSDTENYKSLVKNGADLVSSGYKDPLILLWYGEILYRSKSPLSAEQYLIQASTWNSTGYPHIHAFFALKTLAKISYSKKEHKPKQAENQMKLALDHFAKALISNEFKDDETHIAYRLLVANDVDDFKINKYQQVYEAIRHQGFTDDWFLSILNGRSEIELAWKARGKGWAKNVTNEGWKGFHHHLERARFILTDNWKRYPHKPEAAAAMIIVTMGGHGNPKETERIWFDRSVKSQMDFPPTYYPFITALLPRWGGSHKAMHAFGQECLDTGRFDTDVPLFYLHVLRKIGEELDNHRWRAPFRSDSARKNLNHLFKNMLSETSLSTVPQRIRTQQALVAAWSGDYQKSRALLKKVGTKVDLESGFWGETLSWNHRSWEAIEAELDAFNGANGTILAKAEDLVHDNKIQEALPLFEQAMRHHQGDANVFVYLRDRIALQHMGKSADDVIRPLLNMAAYHNKIEVAEFLLENGADINSESKTYKTPLHSAIYKNHPQMAKLLIEKGANINSQAFGLWTPLHYALRYQQPDLARLLIDRGADINAQTTGNWTPLHFALYYKHLDIALLLIKKGVRTDILTYQNFSPLHYAAAKGNKELVGMLIDRGCDVNSFTIFKIAPLHYALRNEHPRIARLLIEKGADINLANHKNWTPLHYALGNHLPDMAIELIHKGADVNAVTEEGWTPLHFASSFDEYIDVVKLLLEKGADPKASLPDGDTPLSFAKARKAKEVEKLLKQYW
jgi:ankyrin repeat protein